VDVNHTQVEKSTILLGVSNMYVRQVVCIFFLVAFSACKEKQSANAPGSNVSERRTATPTSIAPGALVGPAETAIAPEVNPPGDIPDSQAFVNYRSSPGGYQLDVPEGWARTDGGTNVSFVDKFNGVKVTETSAQAAPTVASVRANEAKQMDLSAHAANITDVSDVIFPNGKTIVIKYTSNSDANAVTNKRVRLENETFIYFMNGKEAMLTLWAPLGADNADQWKRMSNSFRWL
jgi:hypothetical protein